MCLCVCVCQNVVDGDEMRRVIGNNSDGVQKVEVAAAASEHRHHPSNDSQQLQLNNKQVT